MPRFFLPGASGAIALSVDDLCSSPASLIVGFGFVLLTFDCAGVAPPDCVEVSWEFTVACFRYSFVGLLLLLGLVITAW